METNKITGNFIVISLQINCAKKSTTYGWLCLFLLLLITPVTPVVFVEPKPNTVFYKEHMFRTEQLCPDLQDVVSKDIDTANYPYKAVFRQVETQPYMHNYIDHPCVFESKGPRNQVTTAIVKAIYATKNEWNLTTSGTCGEHIKLKFSDNQEDSRYGLPKIICRIPRSVEKAEIRSSLYHPIMWRFPRGKMGLSFATFHESSTQEIFLDDNTTEEVTAKPTSIIPIQNDDSDPQFVQIVFTVHFGKSCSLRIQQYLIDPIKEHCNTSRRFYQLCGAYDCSEEEAILNQMGFWNNQKLKIEQIEKMLKFVRMRRESDASYMQILISTLRAMIMPVLFLVVFYITRKLRLQRSSGAEMRRERLHMQRHSSSNCHNGSSSHVTRSQGHLPSLNTMGHVYDIPVISPPSYNEVMQSMNIPPPAYEEIINENASKPEEDTTTTTIVRSNESHSLNTNTNENNSALTTTTASDNNTCSTTVNTISTTVDHPSNC